MPKFCSFFVISFFLGLYLSAYAAQYARNHRPYPSLTSTFPPSLRACEELKLTWEGGKPPFVIGVFKDNGDRTETWDSLVQNIAAHEFTISVDGAFTGETIWYTIENSEDPDSYDTGDPMLIEDGGCSETLPTTPPPPPPPLPPPPPSVTVTQKTTETRVSVTTEIQSQTPLPTGSKTRPSMSSKLTSHSSSRTTEGTSTSRLTSDTQVSTTNDFAGSSDATTISQSSELLPAPSAPAEIPTDISVSQNQTSPDVRLIVGITVPLVVIIVVVAILLLCRRRRSHRKGMPVADQLPRAYTIKAIAGDVESEIPPSLSHDSKTGMMKQSGRVPFSPTTASQTHLLEEDLCGEVSPLSTRGDSTGATLGQELTPSPLSLFLPMLTPTSGYPASTHYSPHKLPTGFPAGQPSTMKVPRPRRDTDSITIVEERLDEQRQANEELKREIAVLRALGRYSPERLRESYPYTPSSPPAYSGKSLI